MNERGGDPLTKRIVIIGGGPGGYEAALAGAKYGAEITLIEDQGMGGSSIIHDSVPSKSFIAGSGIKTDLRRADDMGLNKGIGDSTIDVQALNERVKSLAKEQSGDVRAQLERIGVRIINGRGRFDDYEAKQTIHFIKAVHQDGTEEVIECDICLLYTSPSPRD